MANEQLSELRGKQDWKGAEELLRSLLVSDSTDAERWFLLAEATGYQGRMQESKAAAFRAIALNPVLYPAWCFLANAHAGLGEWEGVLSATERALQIAPDIPFAHWLKAHGLMAQNEWPKAWQSYEYGFLIEKRKPRCLGRQWYGEPIPGKTLFVWSEQGHGDAIQYARYLAQAKEQSQAFILAEWRPGLLPLLEGMSDIAVAQPADKMIPFQYDYHIPVMSLPHVLGVQEVSGSPYLDAEPSESTKDRIGIVWQGFSGHGNDRNRSMPAEYLDVFKELNPLSLQQGGSGPDWLPSAGSFGDFMATASALKGLRMLITVDTAVAHLAGALGVPTIMIAPLGFTEARWGRAETTPWYDSWRIVHAHDWGEATEKAKCLATS